MVIPWVNCTDEFIDFDDTRWKTTFAVLMTLVSVLSVVGNGIVILVFYKRPSVRRCNVVLVSLSLADFLTGLIVAPIYVILLLNSSLVGNCRFYVAQKYFALAFMGASATHVALISSDRFQRMTKLQNYNTSTTTLYASLAACWLVPLLLPAVGFINEKVYSVTVYVAGIMVAICIVIPYVALLLSIRKHRLTLDGTMGAMLLRNERRAWKTVVIIVTCYLLMILPLLVDKLLYAAGYFDTKGPFERSKLVIVSKFIFAGNSVTNPLIYTCRIEGMRGHVRALFQPSSRSQGNKVVMEEDGEARELVGKVRRLKGEIVQ